MKIRLNNDIKKNFVFIILIVVLVLVFLNKGVRMQGVFFGADEVASDLLHFSYPYREWWADEYLKAGKVPLWNQYLATGLPFLAEAQTGVFYPISVLLYRFLPVPLAFNWLIIFSFMIAGVGTYLYGRKVGLDPGYALFSALVFVFSGFMVVRVRHVPIITAVAFMPFIFWATEHILEGGRAKWAGVLAIFIAVSFFAGHLTTSYAILLVLLVYFLVRFWLISRASKKENGKVMVLFGAGVALGVLLAAVQLLPSLELIKYSTRNESDLQLLTLPFDLSHLVFFVAPYVLGDPSRGSWDMSKRNYWENVGYLGILPLVLAILGLLIGIRRKNRVVQASAAVVILSFLLILGQNTLVYATVWAFVPGFSFTRIPGRFLLFIDFFGSVLAGWGLFYLGRKILVPLAVVVTLADLWFFGYGFNNVMPLSYFSPPKSVEFLKKDKSLFRIRVLEDNEASWEKAWKKAGGWRGDLSAYIAQRENLPGDISLLYRLSTPSLIYALNGHFSPLRPNILDDAASVALFNNRALGARLLGLMNVKYIVSAEKFISGGELSLVYQDESSNFPTYIYENKRVLPRAFMVGKASSFASDKEVLAKLLSEKFQPDKEVLLEKEAPTPGGCEGAEAKIVAYKDTEVEIGTDSRGSCLLVLTDTYYPGWKAFVDDKETEILQANYNFRSILLPTGDHKVRFIYDPWPYKAGVEISLVSLVLAGALALWTKRK